MDRSTAVVATAAAGGLVALQAPINAHLGRSIGSLQAAFLSFCIGTVALLVVASLAKGGLGTIGGARNVSLIYLTGGLLGAVYVTTILIAVRTLGASGVTAATVAGQLAASVVVDQLGLLGVARNPVTLGKIAGILLLAAGVFLVVRD